MDQPVTTRVSVHRDESQGPCEQVAAHSSRLHQRVEEVDGWCASIQGRLEQETPRLGLAAWHAVQHPSPSNVRRLRRLLLDILEEVGANARAGYGITKALVDEYEQYRLAVGRLLAERDTLACALTECQRALQQSREELAVVRARLHITLDTAGHQAAAARTFSDQILALVAGGSR